MTNLNVPDSPKMLRETLCVAQGRIGNSPLDADRRDEHIYRLQRLIDECDRHRPLGPNGKHGDRHTTTCGCIDDQLEPARREQPHWWRMFLRQICDAVGVDFASSASSEAVVNEILPAIERLKSTANMPDWERELLAGQAAQEEIDDLRQQLRDIEAQPDRPEPVDPASVRVGDVVDMEHEDGIWRAVGPVTGVYPQHGGPEYYIFAVRIGVDDVPLSSKYASVCVLHRAEPEPDPAAVEALAKALHAAWASRAGLDHGWLQTGYQRHFLAQAATLIRDHGVRQEVTDA